MHDVVSVTVVQGLENLLEETSCHLLVEVFFLDDAIEKFSSSAESTKREISIGQKDIDKLG